MSDPESDAGAVPRRVGRARPSARLPLWQEAAFMLAAALVLAIAIKALFVQAFYIPSASMNDTLVPDDRILVQKVSYWAGSPSRGDVVVFADPGGWLGEAGRWPQREGPLHVLESALGLVGLAPTGGHLVKRVIAVGGDTVRCCDRRGRLRVNGTPLGEQAYLRAGQRPSAVSFRQRVPSGHLWVMGDNRSQSADSRAHLGQPGGPFVAEEDVVGKVVAVVWPLGHAKTLPRPATFAAVEP